jgi:hypothetical protein
MIAPPLAMLLATTAAVPAQRADVPRQPAAAVAAATRPAPMPTMRLEAQFRGPQQDTVVQRWRDPATNAICYIYLPITVQHSPRTPTGYVQYGANSIGTISCVSGR